MRATLNCRNQPGNLEEISSQETNSGNRITDTEIGAWHLY